MPENQNPSVMDVLNEAMTNMASVFNNESNVFKIKTQLTEHINDAASHAGAISAAIAKHVAETHHGDSGNASPDTPAAPVPPSAPSIVAPDQVVAGRDASIQLVGDAKTTQFVVTVDGEETVIEAPGGRGTFTLSPSAAGDIAMSVVAKDADGNASEAVTKTISAAQINIEPPQITSPVFGEGHINPAASFTVSDMVSDIEDTATGMQLQIAKDAAFTDIVHDETVEGNPVNLSEGVLEGGSIYYVRSRWIGATAGEGPWSAGVEFNTIEAASVSAGGPIIACQVTTGIEGRTWQRLDTSYNALTTDPDFANHPVYAGIVEQVIDGQDMIRFPKCFVKREVIATGEFVGKDCRAVSDVALPGYEIHPAFLAMDGKTALDQIWIAKYHIGGETDDDGVNRPTSKLLQYKIGGKNLEQWREYAGLRNREGIAGFHLWNIHEWSLIQLLCLLEIGGTDVQTLIANVTSNETYTGRGVDLEATWRGICGLWGTDTMCDGLTCNTLGTSHMEIDMGSGYIDTNISISEFNGFGPDATLNQNGEGWSISHLFIGDPATKANPAINGAYSDSQRLDFSTQSYCRVGGNFNAFTGLFSIYLGLNVYTSGSSTIRSRLAKW